jgi:hypothetical protein
VFFFHLRDSFGSLDVGRFNRLSEANEAVVQQETAGTPAPRRPA